MVIICYGIKNSHEPNFFRTFINNFQKKSFDQHIVALDYIEVPKLVKKMEMPFKIIGKNYGKGKIRKALGLIANNLEYIARTPNFDVSITHGNTYLIHASKLLGKPTITFTDNDINYVNHRLYFPFSDYLITPKQISTDYLINNGAKKERILQYDGYKEDIYVADYKPNKDFLSGLPFDNFVTVRAEALKNLYVSGGSKSIVPQIFKHLKNRNINVLFLPRYDSDRVFARGYDNIFVPLEPINGLDACYYSRAILTGAGTFAREAACMGTPAVSFFPGKKLLGVDQEMVDKGLMFHSRNPEEIVDYVLNSKNKIADLNRSKKIKESVLSITQKCINQLIA